MLNCLNILVPAGFQPLHDLLRTLGQSSGLAQPPEGSKKDADFRDLTQSTALTEPDYI